MRRVRPSWMELVPLLKRPQGTASLSLLPGEDNSKNMANYEQVLTRC